MQSTPRTYAQCWQEWRAGRLSSSVLIHMIRTDELFKAYCQREARKLGLQFDWDACNEAYRQWNTTKTAEAD